MPYVLDIAWREVTVPNLTEAIRRCKAYRIEPGFEVYWRRDELFDLKNLNANYVPIDEKAIQDILDKGEKIHLQQVRLDHKSGVPCISEIFFIQEEKAANADAEESRRSLQALCNNMGFTAVDGLGRVTTPQKTQPKASQTVTPQAKPRLTKLQALVESRKNKP